MFRGLEHTAIASPDPRTLAEWYAAHLDFVINYEYAGNYFVRAANGTMLEIIPGKGPLTPPQFDDPGIRHLAIDVDDFDAAHERLKAADVRFLGEPMNKQGNGLLFFADHDGNILHLIQRERPLPSTCAAPGLQGFPLPRISPALVWRLHFVDRHVDADRGAELAGLFDLQVGVHAGPGRLPGANPHCAVFADWRRDRGPHRPPARAAGIAICPDDQRLPADGADRIQAGEGPAHPGPVFRGGLRAVLRRPRVFGAGAHAGRKRRPAERHRAEFHSVQPGARDRPRAWRPGAHRAGRGLVLRAE